MLREKFLCYKTELNDAILEREDVIHQSILSFLVNEHIFLLGKPGIGKSYMAKKFVEAFDYTGSDGSKPYFQIQLSGGTEKSEIFGQPSISKLKKEDLLWYCSEDYFPNARTFLIDEITRANKMALDSILEPINERTYKNGGKVLPTPTEFGYATSNFKFNSEHFSALADRFVSWFELEGLSHEGRRKLRMRQVNKSHLKTKFTEKEVEQARFEVSKVTLSVEADKTIETIRDILSDEHSIEISDRKEEKLCKLVLAQAWLMGRTEAIKEDVIVTIPCFWIDPKHKKKVGEVIRKLCNPQLDEIQSIVMESLKLCTNNKEQPTAFPLQDVSDKLADKLKKLNNITPTDNNKVVYDKSVIKVTRASEHIADLLTTEMRKKAS